MDIHEAIKTVAPVVQAFAEICLHAEELSLVKAEANRVKKESDYAAEQAAIATKNASDLVAKAEQAKSDEVSARRSAEQHIASANAQAGAIIKKAQEDAKKIVDDYVKARQEEINQINMKVEAAKKLAIEADTIVAIKLQRHKEVEDSLAALKAKL